MKNEYAFCNGDCQDCTDCECITKQNDKCEVNLYSVILPGQRKPALSKSYMFILPEDQHRIAEEYTR